MKCGVVEGARVVDVEVVLVEVVLVDVEVVVVGVSRSGSGSLAGSAGADETATALRVPRAVLPGPLTPRTVGSSLTDAKRSQRAPNEGSTHQPKGLTSREAAISQSSSQLVEEAFFSGHRLPPSIRAELSLAPPRCSATRLPPKAISL